MKTSTTAPTPDRQAATVETTGNLLEVRDLNVAFHSAVGLVRPVADVDLTVQPGEIWALVGESGCGKSTLGYSLLDIVPPPGRIESGTIAFRGRDLRKLSHEEFRRLRGAEISMVFQGAMNAFNPVLTIGKQVDHLLSAHPGVFATQAEGRAYFEDLLRLVQLPPERILKSYESQLSGGMKQRVAIALALTLKPSLLILDEPTTALDVLNQRMVIEILQDLHDQLGIAIIFVTHDLAVVAELATHVAVMYAGRIVESGTVDQIFASPRRHPYVKALVGAIPSVLDSGLTVRPIEGQVPNLAKLPSGCRFAPRCPLAEDVCRSSEPVLITSPEGDHPVACHVVNRGLEAATSGARA